MDRACFQHDMAYGGFKSFPERTASDKVLHNKEFNTAKNTILDFFDINLVLVAPKQKLYLINH